MIVAGIILAAGKGTRIKSTNRNKVTLPFLSKPLIMYAVELLQSLAKPVVVVVGAFSDSVKEVLKDSNVTYAYQKDQLGTGHATVIGLKVLEKLTSPPSIVLVGYGDHTMFYKKKIVQKLIDNHIKNKALISCITTIHENPNKLAWGRIMRDRKGEVFDIVEQKDASVGQKKIKELNAGFYCFDYEFLKKNLVKIPKSRASGEYYLNSLIKIAASQKQRIKTLDVTFENVGIGINRNKELEESQKIYMTRMKNSK